MKKESRKWFKLAYRLTSGVLPFSILTSKDLTKEHLKKIVPFADEDFLTAIVERVPVFYEKLPSSQDFIEEKNRIFRKLIPELKQKLSFVETAVLFGSLRNDIDIGLISEKEIPDEIISRDDRIITKYPIVDWNALSYFVSKNGYELAERIAGTRLILKENTLDKNEIAYIKGTIYNSKVLWGDEKQLQLMKDFFIQNLQD